VELDFVELQIHSPSSRRGVRYVRLTKARVRGAILLVGLWGAWVVGATVMAPRVLGSVLGTRQYTTLAGERSVLGERLRGLVDTLARLEPKPRRRAERCSSCISLTDCARRATSPCRRWLRRRRRPDRSTPTPSNTAPRCASARRRSLRPSAGLFDAVEAYELAHAAELSSVPAAGPLRGNDFVLTTTFGVRRSPFTNAMEFHPGIDLAAPVGSEVHAPADGVVAYSGRYPIGAESGRGGATAPWSSCATAPASSPFSGIWTATRVRVGQRVSRGEVVGTVGNTGWSTSPHLHYELRIPERPGGGRSIRACSSSTTSGTTRRKSSRAASRAGARSVRAVASLRCADGKRSAV
jgi:hypothetical protein